MIFLLPAFKTADSAGHERNVRGTTNHLENRRLTLADRQAPRLIECRLLPILLPRQETVTDTWRRPWNRSRGHSWVWTILDDLPMPTDQKAGRFESLRARQVTGLSRPGKSLCCQSCCKRAIQVREPCRSRRGDRLREQARRGYLAGRGRAGAMTTRLAEISTALRRALTRRPLQSEPDRPRGGRSRPGSLASPCFRAAANAAGRQHDTRAAQEDGGPGVM